VCGQRLTIGVLHRVEALAQRSEEEAKPPATAGQAINLVPLPEMLSEIVDSGAASKKVEHIYERTIGALGPELQILEQVPVEDIARADSLLGEAIGRLRAGKVIRDAGYDGEYGAIRLFEDGELSRLSGASVLFDTPAARKRSAPRAPAANQDHWPTAPRPSRGNEASNGDSILASLDDDQRKAVETESPLLIVAGPGSGKTRTLTHRIAHLVTTRGASAENCLAITFTRRAAGEMRERLARLLPGAGTVSVHTFHSLGLTILREHAAAAGLNRGFRIANDADKAAIFAETRGFPANKTDRMLRAISKAKRAGVSPDEETGETLAAYQRGLMLRSLVDFDDLVCLPVKLLEGNPEVSAEIRCRFRWISVDEFQDVDEQQYRLIRLLAPQGENLCVIGDPNQAIYGFRGADASCFERLKADFPNATVVRLARNYRSSGSIVAASAQVIAPTNREGSIAEIVREMHDRITLHSATTERAEAEFVVQSIEGLIGGHNFFSIDSGRANGPGETLSFADVAVLYRADAQSIALVEALERSGIPYKKHSHVPLAAGPAVQAVLNELYDLSTDEPLAVRLREAAERVNAPGSCIDIASVELAMKRLTSLATTAERDGARFADALAVASEADFFDPRAERVSLLTMHAAKGLEFPVVFIVGLEDGILPLHWGASDETSIAEERCLFYVGMTRAMDRLILSRAEARHWRGRRQSLPASRFLTDIESELLKAQRPPPLRPRNEDRQLKLF
jgi:DNA helicase II / ATP-dependent DNA helicase PcrA